VPPWSKRKQRTLIGAARSDRSGKNGKALLQGGVSQAATKLVLCFRKRLCSSGEHGVQPARSPLEIEGFIGGVTVVLTKERPLALPGVAGSSLASTLITRVIVHDITKWDPLALLAPAGLHSPGSPAGDGTGFDTCRFLGSWRPPMSGYKLAATCAPAPFPYRSATPAGPTRLQTSFIVCSVAPRCCPQA